jgi:hypothetical protein
VQELQPQTGRDQRINNLAQAVIPHVRHAAASLVISRVGAGRFNPLRCFEEEVGTLGFELSLRLGPENAEKGVIFDNVENTAGFEVVRATPLKLKARKGVGNVHFSNRACNL